MCGFCGEVRTSGDVSLVELSKATESMHSRGPDAAGFFAQGSIAFGHRRLSILDPAPSSQQPMVDNETRPGPFLSCVGDILNSSQARSRGLYRSDFVEHMLQNPEAEMSPKGHSRLWQVALLEAWMQAHAI